VSAADMGPPTALYKKLLRATKAVGPVKKNGYSKAGKYWFAEAEDIIREAERVLTARQVLTIPGVANVAWKFSKEGAALCTATMTYRVVDVESGESFTETWAGAGFDRDCDKALYQAKTGAAKYFFAQLLKIPIENQDPELDGTVRDSTEAERIRAEQDRAAEQPDLKVGALKPVPESDLPEPDWEGLARA
jgi:ERF superfamily protein